MRRHAAAAGVLGTVACLACNALTGVSDLEAAAEAVGLPDASRSDDVAAGDSSLPIDAHASDAASPDVAAEDAAVDPSLIGFWTFDETSGTTSVDKSGHGRDARLVNGASFAPTSGIRGGAVSLGTSMFVSIDGLSGPAFPATGSFSLWLRWRTMESLEQHGIFDQWSEARNHLYLRHANNTPAGELQIAFQPKASAYVWAHGFDVPQDTWTHVVLTWSESAGHAAAFVNGAKVKDSAYTTAFKPDGQIMRLGHNFDGWLDEVRLYDRALPEAEALMLP